MENCSLISAELGYTTPGFFGSTSNPLEDATSQDRCGKSKSGLHLLRGVIEIDRGAATCGKGVAHHHFSSEPGWVPDILCQKNTGNDGSGIGWKPRHDALLALKHWSDRVSSVTFDSVRKEKELNLGKCSLVIFNGIHALFKAFVLLKLRGHAWRARKEVFFFLSSDAVLTKV